MPDVTPPPPSRSWTRRSVLGGTGLALASSAAVTLYVLALAGFLRHRMAEEDSPGVLGLVVRMAPAVGLAIAAGFGIRAAIDLPALVSGALTGTVAVVLTLGLARLFGVPEVAEVIGLVTSKVRRKLGRA